MVNTPQIVTARIVTSQQSCFVGRLSEKKQTLTTHVDLINHCHLTNWYLLVMFIIYL